ncbi:hypothetical protein ACOSQ4_021092 [Xanthoceras sorbifolium]
MSKTLLSRIKPLTNRKPASSSSPSSFPPTPRIKQLVHEIIQILKTHHEYQHSLDFRFSDEEDIHVSEIAHFVFDRLHDVELGFKFFDWLAKQPKGSSSGNGYAWSSFLKLLARFRVFSEIELALNAMKLEQVKPTHEALSVVVRAYADSGQVDQALDMYYYVIGLYDCGPNVLACNSLLALLVDCKKVKIACKLYDEMCKRDDGVDNYSTCIIAKGLCKEGKVEEGRKLIEERFGGGCIPNIVFYNTLIDGYCKRGDVKSANRLFRELKWKGFVPTLETYGAMVNGFCKEGNFKAIDRLLMEMKKMGLEANVRVYNNIIDAKYKHGFKVEAMDTVRWMIESGCEPDIVTYNTLISGSCRDGKVQEASQLLEQAMKSRLEPNNFSYTPLMHVYCKQGDYVKASGLLIEMTERGHKPDLVAYGALIHGLVAIGEVEVAVTIRDKMMERGVLPDAGIYNVIMSGLCKKGRFPAARNLLAEMLDYKVLPDAFVYTTLVDGFIRSGDLQEAKHLFETIEKSMDPGVVGYNAMIKGYCKFGLMKDVMLCVKRMVEKHHAPDEFTYSTIIDGYVKQHDLDNALRMFGEMVKKKCKPNVVTYTALINGFFRIGDSDRAEKTFKDMQSCGLVPNVVTYTIIIGSFSKQGRLAKAASFFELMLTNNCIPNDVTFNYVVNGFTNNAPNAVSISESEESNKSIFLEFFGRMMSDGWSCRAAAYDSILICLCCYGMVKTALQLHGKMASKGFLQDPVSFAALLYGVCLEGRSKDWKNIIPCDLNEQELQIALKYAQCLDQYLPQGMAAEASLILQTLVEDHKSQNQKVGITRPQ